MSDAVDVWLGKIRERREDSTLDIYQHWLKKVVLPQLGELRLVECDVAQIDAFFSRLERMRRTAAKLVTKVGNGELAWLTADRAVTAALYAESAASTLPPRTRSRARS